MSLVVTTLGRITELERLFDSLAAQSFKNFDVTLVDQNDDDRLAALDGLQLPFPVQRIRTLGERGASRGRNRGWRSTRGRLVLFPDDDCWYPPDFLERARAIMMERGCDILSGRPADESGRTINGRFEPVAQAADRANIWTIAIEWLVIYRREVLEAVQGFDEDIGVGASTPWQSSEIQDILLRALNKGFSCWFDPSLVGHHEEVVTGAPTERMRRKGRAYARGMGYVLALHGFGAASKVRWVVRPVGGAAVSLLRGRIARALYYGQVAVGRAEGIAGRRFRSP